MENKIQELFYFMQKECSKDSWINFLDEIYISEDEWIIMKHIIEDKLSIKIDY